MFSEEFKVDRIYRINILKSSLVKLDMWFFFLLALRIYNLFINFVNQ